VPASPGDAWRRLSAPVLAALAVLPPGLAWAQQPGLPIPLIPPAPPLSEEPGSPPSSLEPPITSERLSAPASGWGGDIAPPERALPATVSRDPVALSAALSGLQQVGLDTDMRRLAVEAALAAGL
jgi:hypothetical protein